MKRVEIDPKTLEEEAPQEKKQTTMEKHPFLEKETPLPEAVQPVSGARNIMKSPKENGLNLETAMQDRPSAGLENLLSKAETTTASTQQGGTKKDFNNDPALGLEEALKLPDPPTQGNSKALGKVDDASSSQEEGNGRGQFSSLDQLLASTEMVKKNTAPILMPTDLLFEYDSSTLKPAAAETLTKLGSLIKRNTSALFRIEGHTDSFGSDDYNFQLSLRRAEAVKTWLVGSMGLNPSQISTIGLGKSRLLVPSSGSVDQQQLNRRVEIVITVPK
jgi:outer membrane protein OmpA-like peptidoglycan-associated protein